MDILFHWLIPVVILLAFSSINKKTILLLGVFALLPDVDALFGMHRMVFHSIFIVIIPLALYVTSKKHKLIFILIAYFLLSHVLLDLASPGVSLLYPVTDERFYFPANFMFKDREITPVIEYGIAEHAKPGGSPAGEFIGNSSIMCLILILLLIAVQILLEKKTGKNGFEK